MKATRILQSCNNSHWQLNIQYFYFKCCLFVMCLFILHLIYSPVLLATNRDEDEICPSIKKICINEPRIFQGSFAGLPNDILIHHIIPFLQAPDIFSLRRSCKGLYGVMKESNPIWKRLYIGLKAKGSLDFEEAVSSWQILFQATTVLQRQIKELSLMLEPTVHLIESALLSSHPFIFYVKGIHTEMLGRINENKDSKASAFEYYQKASIGGYSAARRRLTLAVYGGELGFEICSIEDRRAMLEQKASEGDYYAQGLIDYAHFCDSPLKYREKPQSNYFETLKARTQELSSDAVQVRKRLIEEIALGKFEYASMSENERCQHLHRFEEQREVEARYWINRALYTGLLGYGQLIEQERFNRLAKRASENDENARDWLYKALYNGTLAQDMVSKTQRFKKLLEDADNGHRTAQEYLSQAYYDGGLSQQNVSKKKRFEALLKREQQGEPSAQKYITHAFYYGALHCDKLSNKQRFEILLSRATKGDRQAQVYICEVFIKGELGQQKNAQNALVMEYNFLLLNTVTGNLE